MNMNTLAENNTQSYNFITHFGVIAVDCPEAILASSDLDNLCRSVIHNICINQL